MKVTSNEKLRALLVAQREAVTLVAADGTERRGISARSAAAEIAGAAVTGYGSHGVVEKIVARRRPAIPPDIRAAMTDFPRLPHVHKNPQTPGAIVWVPQPTFAHTGHVGKVTTVFRPQTA